MRKVFGICGGIILLFMILLSGGLKTQQNTTFLRIHIRANSNLAIDQNVKYLVKNEIVDYLTPLLVDGQTFEKAKIIIKQNLQQIEQVATNVLAKQGFSYTAKANLNSEYFPVRTYSAYTLESGFYDALILSLGTGEGDNWWCVVYPPLCFTNGSASLEYKSIIWDIIQKWVVQQD